MFKPEKVNLDVKDLKYEFINGKLQKRKSFDANGHDFVEIAGIKWATMNVGANKVTDYGLYFQWGDTQGYTKEEINQGKIDRSNYKFTTDGGKSFTKYNGTDGKTVLDLEDDAVHAAWGGSWRMPTKEEINTVLNSSAVTKNWIPNYQGSNVAGYEIHDKNSNDTLFLPACGYANSGAVYYAGVYGDYWLSSLYTDDVSTAYSLYFSSDDVCVDYGYRYDGLCVRGVLAEN